MGNLLYGQILHSFLISDAWSPYLGFRYQGNALSFEVVVVLVPVQNLTRPTLASFSSFSEIDSLAYESLTF